MRSVYAALHDLFHPMWMRQPGRWIWHTPSGSRQGFGLNWAENIGQSNLLWLTLQQDSPPEVMDTRHNAAYILVLVASDKPLHPGWPSMQELARTHSLEGFAIKLRRLSQISPAAVGNFLELAEARLNHASR